jgi:hypothetical protein
MVPKGALDGASARNACKSDTSDSIWGAPIGSHRCPCDLDDGGGRPPWDSMRGEEEARRTIGQQLAVKRELGRHFRAFGGAGK